MQFPTASLLTFVVFALGVVAQTPSAATTESSATHAQGIADLGAIPSCFLTCSGEAATQVGCSSASDLPCVCTKQAFVTASGKCTLSKCPEIASNMTASNASFSALATACQAAVGDKFALTMPTAADLMAHGNHSVAHNGTAGAAHTNGTAETGKADAAGNLSPPMAHLASAAVVLSVFLGGASLVA